MKGIELGRPSPALVVAMAALLFAMGGTAGAVVTAAVPLAKRALVADNAKKLEGQSLAQLTAKTGQAVAAAASAPGPASTAAALVTTKTAPWSLGGNQASDFAVACDAGQKAMGGGYDNPSGDALALDTRPSSDGAGWRVFLLNLSASAGASGSVYAVCLR